MKVLIIIVSYNFEKWIDRCLGSLRKSDFPTDVVVIDNDSKDRTVALLEKNYPEVRLIKTGENLGFGRANNIGIKIALNEGYDFVFLLNQDAWISADTIRILIDTALKHPEYGILSPVHLDGTEEHLDEGFASYTGVKTKNGCISNDKGIIPVSFINAAFWMLPRKTLETVGGFSPLFYHYGEDIDYVNRVKYHKMKIGYSPKATGCHDRAQRSKPTRKAFMHAEYVYHLSEYANINFSLWKAFSYGILACGKKALTKDFVFYTKILWKLITKTGEVLKARKQYSNTSLHI